MRTVSRRKGFVLLNPWPVYRPAPEPILSKSNILVIALCAEKKSSEGKEREKLLHPWSMSM
jgi:hypothetical protein